MARAARNGYPRAMRSKTRFTPGDFAACVPPACAVLMLLAMSLRPNETLSHVRDFLLLALLTASVVAIGAVGMGFLLHTLGDLVEGTWCWKFQRRQYARVAACLLGVCLSFWGSLWIFD